jgi:hypothetical protein
VDSSDHRPAAKKIKLNRRKKALDQYEATNYLPTLSDEEKDEAEKVLANAKNTELVNMDDVFDKTKALQRHFVTLTVKDLFDKFPWLKKVRIV